MEPGRCGGDGMRDSSASRRIAGRRLRAVSASARTRTRRVCREEKGHPPKTMPAYKAVRRVGRGWLVHSADVLKRQGCQFWIEPLLADAAIWSASPCEVRHSDHYASQGNRVTLLVIGTTCTRSGCG